MAASAGHGNNSWWIVHYTTSSVASRFTNPSQPQTIIVQAPTKQAADTAAHAKIGGAAIISATEGPYATQADAQGTLGKETQKITNAEQAGSITLPGFLGILTEGNVWKRVGEFGIGGVILYVALRAMFPSEVQAATGAVKGAAKLGTAAAA